MAMTVDLPPDEGGWRWGRIETHRGRLVGIRRRWLPQRASLWRVWCDTHFRWGQRDRCLLDYHQPRGCPGMLVVDYIRSGPGTTLQTFRGALSVLDAVAHGRRASAIVAHIGTSAISDRLLRRWGWQPHLQHWRGRHWIKRYDDRC